MQVLTLHLHATESERPLKFYTPVPCLPHPSLALSLRERAKENRLGATQVGGVFPTPVFGVCPLGLIQSMWMLKSLPTVCGAASVLLPHESRYVKHTL